MITTEQIKELRDKTNVSVMQCKKALEEAGGDMEKAMLVLKRKGTEFAAKKSDRELKAGLIEAYIHGGKIGVMLEILCESDFVAKNDLFKELAHDVAMHIAALNPEFVSETEIKENDRKLAEEVFNKEVEGLDKPEEIKIKILQGKIETYFKEKTLLDQNFVKNPDITVADLIKGVILKLGEKIEIARFIRFSLLEK